MARVRPAPHPVCRRPVRGAPAATALVLGALFLALGCSGAVRDSAREAGAGGVEGMYDGLRKISADEAAFSRTIETVTRAVIAGSQSGMAQLDLDALTERVVAAVSASLARHGRAELLPLVQDFSRTLRQELAAAIDQSLRQAGRSLRAAVEADLARAVGDITRAAVDGLSSGVQAAVDGPLSGLGAKLLGDDLRERASRLTHDVTAAAVDGAMQALDDALQNRLAKSVGAFLDAALAERLGERGSKLGIQAFETLKAHFKDEAAAGVTALEVALVSGGSGTLLLLILAVVALVMVIRRNRANAKALTVVAENINHLGNTELKRSIQAAAERNGIQSWLSDFLKSRGL